MSAGFAREWMIVSSSLKPALLFLIVTLETTFWSAAEMMQQSCLYLEISIPINRFIPPDKYFEHCCLPQRIRLCNHVNKNVDALTNWLTVIDEKLWSESPPNSQSCNDIGTDPQCFKYYNGVFNKTQEMGERRIIH